MRIALRHFDLDGSGWLLFRDRREKDEAADDEHQDDDQDCNSWHGQRFCRGGEPLYSPLRLWIWQSVLTSRWFSSV